MAARVLVDDHAYLFDGVLPMHDYTLRAYFTNTARYTAESYTLPELKQKLQDMAAQGHTSAALVAGCAAMEGKPCPPPEKSGVRFKI